MGHLQVGRIVPGPISHDKMNFLLQALMKLKAAVLQPLPVVHGRDKIRHDHRPRERLYAQECNRLEYVTFAQVQMHVEGRRRRKHVMTATPGSAVHCLPSTGVVCYLLCTLGG